jgi:hypothetical protein
MELKTAKILRDGLIRRTAQKRCESLDLPDIIVARLFDEVAHHVPTIYMALVFSLFVGVFGILEHTIGGLLRGRGLAGGFDELMSVGKHELLARCLVTFFAFIPFFAFKELERVLGAGQIHTLFFGEGRRRSNLGEQ